MKNRICNILILILISFFIRSTSASAYTSYTLEDYAYFDPLTTNPCNETNYWTYYNKNTSCYRFIVLNPNDSASNETLKVMLDHDVGSATYDQASSVLSTQTASWSSRYSGTITLPDEDTFATLLKLGNERPSGDNELPNPDNKPTAWTLSSNTYYVYNGATVDKNGYWLSGATTNTNYAYAMNNVARNIVSLKTKTRGVRPMLNISKSLLTKGSVVQNITGVVRDATEYKYPHADTINVEGTNYTYRQMQGFTVTNSNIILYSSYNGLPTMGWVIAYGGNHFQTRSFQHFYEDTAHGNSMTYNPKTNRYLLAGPYSNTKIYEYNADTFAKTKTYDELPTSYGQIGYDEVDNLYVSQNSRRIYVLNNQINQAFYTFDSEHLLTSQDLEYHKGYVYYTTSENGSPSEYQLYAYGDRGAAKIFVYNAKLKANGSPEPNFGRLAKVFYVENIPRGNFTGTGELEGISFRGGKAYLGYAAQHFDTENTYKFYEFDAADIEIDQKITTSSDTSDTSTTVVLRADSELKSLSGWTLSNSKNSLSKTYTDAVGARTVTICDRYDNCKNVSLPAINTAKQNVSFTKSSIQKEFDDGSFTMAATTDGNGTISYTSSNDGIATVDSSGEVTFHGVGTVTITATASKTNAYYKGTASYTLTITKTNQVISFSTTIVNKTYEDEDYTLAATLNVGNGTVTYTSSNEEVATVDNQGTVHILNAGTTTITATVAETGEYAATSASYALNVVAKAQNLAFPDSMVQKKLSDNDFTIEANPVFVKGPITYSSNNEEVAVVDNQGKVTLKGVGVTVITATAASVKNYDSTSASYALNVTKGQQTMRLKNEDEQNFVRALGADPFKLEIDQVGNGALSYESSDLTVATISEDGIVTIVGPGTTVLTIRAAETDQYITTVHTITLRIDDTNTIAIPNTVSFLPFKILRIVVSLILIFVGCIYIYRKKFFVLN